MSTIRSVALPGGRVAVAAGLGILAGVLLLLDRRSPVPPEERAKEVRADLRSVNTVVETLLVRSGIDRSQVRSWQVQTPDRKFIRTERRVVVPPDFISVKFNHALNRALEGSGARVVATERTKGNTVTFHIKTGATIIESITFVISRKPGGLSRARRHSSRGAE